MLAWEEWRERTRTICGGSELTTCCEAVGHEAFKEDGVEVGAGEVDGCGVPCRTGPDDDLCVYSVSTMAHDEHEPRETDHFGVHLGALCVASRGNGSRCHCRRTRVIYSDG